MVFNNENFFFSAKHFSLRNESNNFSDLIKTDKEDELNYDENIDDNFISLSTEFSSLSSITTTTSAYSSCSESSNCVPFSIREFESANEDEYIEAADSNLFYQIISGYIDFYYDHKRKLTAETVSNYSDLKQSKTLWNFLIQKNIDSCPRQDLMSQITKILLSITTVENELVKFINEDLIFEHEFVLNLAFLLYEYSEKAPNLETNSCLIFEIDLNQQIEANFEKILKFLVQKYVSKYITFVITQENSDCSSGKFWINFFKALLENESFNELLLENNSKNIDNFQYENFLDIEMFLSKPLILNDYVEFKNSNPISQGYRQLLDNLEKLQYICNDPINDYENESEMFGRVFHDRSKFFSYFSACYYTMGLFDLKKTLFDNPLQSIYEIKLLNEECYHVFKNDSISNEWKVKMIESLKITSDEFSALFESVNLRVKENDFKKSQWNIEMNQDLKVISISEQHNLKTLCEEVIERIETLNTTVLFNNYFKDMQQCQIECSCDDFSPKKDKKIEYIQSNRKWTVAPKLFSKNTTINCLKRVPSPCVTRSNYTPESQKNFDDFSDIRVRSDLRPIGTKPASMFTISSLNRNRTQNKYYSINNAANKEQWGIITNVIN